MSKPREFWLYDNGEEPFLSYYSEDALIEDTQNKLKDKYHVIEYSAYSELKDQAQKLAEALEYEYQYKNGDIRSDGAAKLMYEALKQWREYLEGDK